jgi:hypothetical protein
MSPLLGNSSGLQSAVGTQSSPPVVVALPVVVAPPVVVALLLLEVASFVEPMFVMPWPKPPNVPLFPPVVPVVLAALFVVAAPVVVAALLDACVPLVVDAVLTFAVPPDPLSPTVLELLLVVAEVRPADVAPPVVSSPPSALSELHPTSTMRPT